MRKEMNDRQILQKRGLASILSRPPKYPRAKSRRTNGKPVAGNPLDGIAENRLETESEGVAALVARSALRPLFRDKSACIETFARPRSVFASIEF
jgi:hypothetical protein